MRQVGSSMFIRACLLTLVACQPGAPQPATPQPTPQPATAPAPTAEAPPTTPAPAGKPAPATTRREAPRPADGKPVDATTPEQRKAFKAAIRDGRKATAKNQFSAAIAAYDAALAAIADHPRALSGRGYAKLLSGDLDGATTDLERALSLSPPPEIQGAAHFNLGLVAEKRGELTEAKRQFQLSNTIRPSKAAAKKLAGGPPVCAAAIDRTVAEPRKVASWLALAREVLTDGEAPKTEAEARDALCKFDASSQEQVDGCAGEPPWHLVNNDEAGWMHRLVRPAGEELLVLDMQSWTSFSRCGGFDEFELTGKSPLLVRYAGSEGMAVEVKLKGDEMVDCGEDDDDCQSACLSEYDVQLEYVVVDPATLRRSLSVQVHATSREDEHGNTVGGPQLKATLEAGGLKIKGEGCDELVPLAG
jgi:hypothetical protein